MIRIAYCIMKLRPALPLLIFLPFMMNGVHGNLYQVFRTWEDTFGVPGTIRPVVRFIKKYLVFDTPLAPKRQKWHENMSHEPPYLDCGLVSLYSVTGIK